MTPRPLLGLLATILALCLLMWGWATMDRPAQTPLEYLPPVVLAGLLVAVLLALFRPDKPMKNPICWWLGHRNDEWLSHGIHIDPHGLCTRCGDPLEYEDLAGWSRHELFLRWCRYWFFKRWIPTRCPDCQKRFGKHEDCLPF